MDEDVILKTAQLGVEFELFKNSAVGKRIIEKAEVEIIEAMRALSKVSPHNVEEITKLQNDIVRADSILSWIEEAIEDGNYAVNEIRNE